MPMSAPRACAEPGCRALVRGYPRCPEHRRKREQGRGTSTERGYGALWRKYRLGFLRENPLCVLHLARGLVVPATVCDHIEDHKGDQVLFWAPSNHRALCARCHNERVDSGDFGR